VRNLKLMLARNRRVYRWSLFALNLVRFAARRPHDPDFAAFAKFGDRPGVFLDVGANTGQSALAFRIFNRDSRIVSVEANVLLEPELRLVRWLLRRFSYFIFAAGDVSDSATLYVPVFRGLPLTGEASLDRAGVLHPWWVEQTVGSGSTESVDVVEVPVTIRRLDDLALQPAWVKIDVEGAEPQVLRGMEETIQRHRPLFPIEDAGSHDEVSRLERGYEPYEYAADEDRLRTPRDRSARNLFYLPQELQPG